MIPGQDRSPPTPTELIWVTPQTDRTGGGTLYNLRTLRALEDLGVGTMRLDAPGRWPVPAADDVESLGSRLRTARADRPEAVVVVDGLIAAGAPQLFSGDPPAADVLLLHLPVARDGAEGAAVERERRALGRASRVVVTGRWAADQVRAICGRDDAEIIVPGTEPPGPTFDPGRNRGDAEPTFAVVASLTPRKNHRLVGEALSGLLGLRWRLLLAGPGAETPFGRALLADLDRLMPGRVSLRGQVAPEDMDRLWAETDLLLLPSTAETYGMVVTEAAARGIPAFVSAGTGAAESVADAGRALPVDSPTEWSQALRRWLNDPREREELAAAADRRRDMLPTWRQSALRWTHLVRSLRTG
ncbi:MAG: glycosyltransferase family 4 protein [Nesterenkonia sp.]|nr:glycosyltransferase family 4 protein [Nesterenkonia sp.]